MDKSEKRISNIEGNGRVAEYVGGYEDWLRQRPPADDPSADGPDARGFSPAAKSLSSPAPKRKLSYKEQRELEALPSQSAQLEAEQQELRARSMGPGFYKEGPDAIRTVLARLEALDALLVAAYERWNDLDSVR